MQMTSPSGVSLGSCSWVSAQSSKSTLWTSPCCSLERLKIRFWENFQLISKLTTQNHQNAPNLVDGPVMEENPRGKNVSLTKHHLGHSKRHTGQRFLQPPRPHQFRVPFSKRVISQLEAKHTTVIVSCIHHNPKAKKNMWKLCAELFMIYLLKMPILVHCQAGLPEGNQWHQPISPKKSIDVGVTQSWG